MNGMAEVCRVKCEEWRRVPERLERGCERLAESDWEVRIIGAAVQQREAESECVTVLSITDVRALYSISLLIYSVLLPIIAYRPLALSFTTDGAH